MFIEARFRQKERQKSRESEVRCGAERPEFEPASRWARGTEPPFGEFVESTGKGKSRGFSETQPNQTHTIDSNGKILMAQRLNNASQRFATDSFRNHCQTSTTTWCKLTHRMETSSAATALKEAIIFVPLSLTQHAHPSPIPCFGDVGGSM
eukprot:scaffold44458_cov52-Attheya_sp.AAC.3